MKKIASFFKLVRWFHELVVILPFVALYFTINYYAQKNHTACLLPGFDFSLLCLCVQLLIAAGCVMNDIADRDIDKINKPKTHVVDNAISYKEAKMIFVFLSLCILAVSVYISAFVFYEWALISTAVYFFSFLYNFYLKRSPLFGNIFMALLTAFIPLVLFFFAKDCINKIDDVKINLLIYLYAAFPFIIITARELSLDISDMEGDKAGGCRTLPLVIGIKRSKLLVMALLTLIILLSLPLALIYDHLIWPLLVVDVLLLVYIYKLKRTETRIEYIRIGRFLWFIMIFGLVMLTVSTIIH